jgi:hypothetical protein
LGQFIGLLNGLGALNDAVATLFFLFLLRMLLRSELLAAAGVCAILGFLAGTQSWIVAPWILIASALYMAVQIRFGLFASVVAFYVVIVLINFPMTIHASAWYANIGFAGLAIILALTAYGFRIAIGNRPLLNPAISDD